MISISKLRWVTRWARFGLVGLAVGLAGPVAATPLLELNWSEHPVPGDGQLRDVAASPTALVAVGHGGLILRSEDGRTWSVIDSGTQAALAFVHHDDGVFVAGGQSDLRFSLDDGLSWNPSVSPPGSYRAAVRLQDQWIAFRHGGLGSSSVVRSGDLVAWEVIPDDPLAMGGLIDAAASDGSGIVLAITAPAPAMPFQTDILWSDGQQPWTAVAALDAGTTSLQRDLPLYVASGSDYPGGPLIKTSADGQAWNALEVQALPYTRLLHTASGRAGHLALGVGPAGVDPALVASTDLSGWSHQFTPAGMTWALTAWRSGWVAVGDTIIHGQPGPAAIPAVSAAGLWLLVLALLALGWIGLRPPTA